MTTSTAELRRCIGSAKFGIEAHEAPTEDFPKQPSQRDGLGRMCRPHWNAYTTGLRKAALARKAAEAPNAAADGRETEPPVAMAETKAKRRSRRGQAAAGAEVAQEDAAS